MNPSFPTCSLVTPTYNWPEALDLLLESVKKQTILPNEVIVADDGSTSTTKEIIEKHQSSFPIPLIHIWHKDNGNQKPKIMNKAIAKAKGDYIVEIDGDIIMEPHFIEDHLSFAKKGLFLYGSRVTIKKTFLPTLFKNRKIKFHFFSSGIKKRTRTLRIPTLANKTKIEDFRSHKLRGCNMSFWKEDFIAVNGFNENLVGWGIDDSELIQRMINNGVQGRRLKFKAIAYHIYHLEQSKSNLQINLKIEEETTKSKTTYIEKGVDQYLNKSF